MPASDILSRPLSNAILNEPRSELAMLLLASFAVVTTILLVVLQGTSALAAQPKLQAVLVLSTVLAGVAGAATLWLKHARTLNAARGLLTEYDQPIAQLSLEAIVAAEPQVLAFWEAGAPVQIVSHTLRTVQGIPEHPGELEALNLWLDERAQTELRAALDALFVEARPFNLILKTRAGGHFEAEGATAGGRALMRLRDLVGYKRDLAIVIDQNRALTQDLAAMRHLLDALPNAVWLRNSQGHITWANRAYMVATESPLVDSGTRKPAELLDRNQIEVVQRTVLAQGRFHEQLSVGHDDERVLHDVTVLAAEGCTVGIAVDATAQDSLQDELANQIAGYARTLQGVATGALIFGAEGRLIFSNEAWQQLFTIDTAWLEAQPTFPDVLDRLNQLGRLPFAEDYRAWRVEFLEAVTAPHVSADQSINYETWWHLFDGRTLKVTTERQADGAVVALFDDVTQAISLESRYNELIATQRETIDTLKEAVAVFGPDGRLRLFNSAFVQAWRLSRAMLSEGPHIEQIFALCRPMTDDDRPWTRLVETVTGLGEDRGAIEGQLTRKDSGVYDYAAVPLPDGATLLTFLDVTKAKSYERALTDKYQAEMERTKALQQANEALMNADRLKSQLISHVSYEFRTPLTTILGYAEFMESGLSGALNTRQLETLEAITSAGNTLLGIFDDILDLALIDAGGLELKRSPVEVGRIVDSVVQAVSQRAEANEITITVNVPEPDAILIADDMRVRQILFNLMSNAIGFSQAGAAVSLSALSTPKNTVFTVSDAGVGIPDHIKERMFERFESKSQGSAHRGAGLGLAIVRSLVVLHGGHIAVDTLPGVGTSISVTLPRTDGMLVEAPVAQSSNTLAAIGEQLALPFYAEAS